MLTVTWLDGLVRRRRGRLLGAATGIAVAVALLASIGSFLSASKATMTTRAARSVTVAWQVELQPGADLATVQPAVAAFRGVTHALPVLFAKTTGFTAVTSGPPAGATSAPTTPTTQTTGPGSVLGLPEDYRTVFADQIRPLVGADTGVLLTQQTATNLHAGPGDRITIGRAGLSDATVVVAGVVDLPGADSLFQKVGAPSASQPKAPPDNVLLLPATVWHAT